MDADGQYDPWAPSGPADGDLSVEESPLFFFYIRQSSYISRHVLQSNLSQPEPKEVYQSNMNDNSTIAMSLCILIVKHNIALYQKHRHRCNTKV
jgi:hypothetical protein